MSYKSWLKRKENATPYANEANCRRCIHGEWVRTSAFYNGNGKPKKIPYNAWDTDKTSYCPEYIPREQKIEELVQLLRTENRLELILWRLKNIL